MRTPQWPRDIWRYIFYRFRGLGHCGRSSWVRPPYCLRNRRYIRIGSRVRIQSHARLEMLDSYAGASYSPELSIGDDVYIGSYFHAACASRIVIEDDCVLSDWIYLNDSAHGMDLDAGPILDQPLIADREIVVKRGTFIGYRSIILPGVTLGQHCVVACNSVVMQSFPAYSVVAGSPARVIRMRAPGGTAFPGVASPAAWRQSPATPSSAGSSPTPADAGER